MNLNDNRSGIKDKFNFVDTKSTWSFEDAELTLTKVDLSAGHSKRISIIALAEDILHHNEFTELEMDSIKSLMKKYLGIKKGALDKVAKAASVNDDDQELTHWDIVEKYIEQFVPNSSEVVGCEGCLWIYNDKTGLYEELPLTGIENKIGKYFPGNNCKKGHDYTSIARLVYNRLQDDLFFSEAPYGVSAHSNFIRIAENASIISEPYTPKHRQRHKLNVDPKRINTPMFSRYLGDTFGGHDYKDSVALVQQILGGLISGTFNKLQKAVLLKGNGSNGKSVLLEILENMFPPGIKCAITPDKFENEYYRAELAGKVINIIGELDETTPLKSSFKDIIGCDTPVTARSPYKAPFSFKPKAGHIFASNHFPKTRDHSHGFYRRWAIISFKNTVPANKKIPNLGSKIADKELPQVLAWALIGAEKLAQNNFILPLTKSHEDEMKKWQSFQNSVLCFLEDDDVVECIPGSKTPKKYVYSVYRNWCMEMGLKSVRYQNFLKTVEDKFSEATRSGGPRCFEGIRIKPTEIAN